jgi:hypothetical protein
MTDLPDRIDSAIAEAETSASKFAAMTDPNGVFGIHACARQVLRAAEVDRRYLAHLTSHHDEVRYADELPSGQCESPDCETPDGIGGWPCQGWLDLAERYGVTP